MKTLRIIAASLLLGTALSCQKEETLFVEQKATPHTVTIEASLGSSTKTIISQDSAVSYTHLTLPTTPYV